MTARAFRLPIEGAFYQYGPARPGTDFMSSTKHHERYGYDLAWVAARGNRVVCSGCGRSEPFVPGSPLVDRSALMRAFIGRHSGCVRVQGRRAA